MASHGTTQDEARMMQDMVLKLTITTTTWWGTRIITIVVLHKANTIHNMRSSYINASKHKKLQKQQSWMRFNQKWSKSCIIKNIREFFLSAIKFNYTELQGELQLVMRTVTCEKATICTSTTFNLLPFSSSLLAAKRSWVINMQEWLTYWSDCIFIKKFKYRKEDGKSKTASVGHEDLWYVTWVCCII